MAYGKSKGVQRVLRQLHRFVFQSVPNTASPEVDLSRLQRLGPKLLVDQDAVRAGVDRRSVGQVSDFPGHVKT
jgi:hypothetical protein